MSEKMTTHKIVEGLKDSVKGNVDRVTVDGVVWQRLGSTAVEKEASDIAAFIDETTRPYRKQINESPALLSLLYDIDLLPEQIRLPVNATRMVAMCEMFKRLIPEAIASLTG